jgi:hypothetical protein
VICQTASSRQHDSYHQGTLNFGAMIENVLENKIAEGMPAKPVRVRHDLTDEVLDLPVWAMLNEPLQNAAPKFVARRHNCTPSQFVNDELHMLSGQKLNHFLQHMIAVRASRVFLHATLELI